MLTNKEYVYQKFKSQKVNKKAKNLIAGHHAKARKGRKLTSSDPLTVLTRPLDEYSVNIVQHTDTIIAEDLDYQNLQNNVAYLQAANVSLQVTSKNTVEIPCIIQITAELTTNKSPNVQGIGSIMCATKKITCSELVWAELNCNKNDGPPAAAYKYNGNHGNHVLDARWYTCAKSYYNKGACPRWYGVQDTSTALCVMYPICAETTTPRN